MKTIKQIADELGVSKQSVYKRYRGKLYTEVYPYTHTENGTVYISEQGENIIKQDFLKDNTVSSGVDTEHIQEHNGADMEYIPKSIIDTLNKTIELLQNQLSEKDTHIAELTKLLNQSQQLQCGTIQRLTEPTEQKPLNDISIPQKRKRLFNIFGKSSNK